MNAIAQREADSEKETPTRQLDEDALFSRLQSWFSGDWDHHLEWVKGGGEDDGGAKEDYEFAAQRQWNEEALEILRKQNRPASVFDRIGPMVDAVCGHEVSNRQEIRYIPREIGDAGVNELVTEAARWFRDLSDAEDEESDAFRDTVICGKGWTETRIDYEDNPDGSPVVSRVNPLEICADRDACKPNYVDRRRTWRVRRMTVEEALSVPGLENADPSDLHASWASDADFAVSQSTDDDDDYRGDNPVQHKPAECVIIECQWWEIEPFVRYVDPSTGQIQSMEQDKFTTLMDRIASIPAEQLVMMGVGMPINPVFQGRKVFRRAYIGKKLLSVVPMPVEGHFTYECITGKRDHNRNHFYGLVRSMKDPARWTNKLFSQIMHILNSNAKGGLIVERGAIEDEKKFSEDYARGDSIVYVNRDGINRIQPKQPAQFPQGHGQMLEFSMNAMPLVTGINQELLGMRDATQPGVLEYQRRQAGLTILQPLFDSLRRYRKEQGRLMLKLIQEYLSDGRLVKIAGKDGERYIPLLREKTAGEYDIIVDEAPTAPNAKERDWNTLQPFIQMLLPAMQTNEKLAEAVLSRSPLPESVVKSIIEAMKPQQPQPPNPDVEIAKRLALAKQVADIKNKEAETEDSQASALGRKARAMKDMSDVLNAFAVPDIPSPPVGQLYGEALTVAPQQQMPRMPPPQQRMPFGGQ